MSDHWKQWEGRAAGDFPLRRYLGGTKHSATFLTERAGPEPEPAAIKLIPADPASADLQLSRWQAAAQLSHPNLIRIFHGGRCQQDGEDVLYVVMEFAEENLAEILPQRVLTATEARDLLAAITGGLAYLHGEGLVHGRIQPSNILATGDQVKLSSDSLCPVGEAVDATGSLNDYAPPETHGKALPSGDVWSLGVTLVQALTQRLPLWEKTSETEPLVPEKLPASFADLVGHCLRREPQHRWTVSEIQAWLKPPLPEPPPQPKTDKQAKPRTPRSSAKPRFLVPVAAIAGLALLAIWVGPRLFNRNPEAQPAPSTESAQPPASPNAVPAEKKVPSPEPRPIPTRMQSSGVAAPAPPPATTATQTATGNRARGEVFHQVLPDVPAQASDTIRGTVRVGVRVAVDPAGRVTEATLDSPGPSRYFANLSLQAAKRWEFWAPKIDGRAVASEWLLRFEFTQTETRAIPRQLAP